MAWMSVEAMGRSGRGLSRAARCCSR